MLYNLNVENYDAGLEIIFDFGCNEGQNILYFISKCDKLVVVDANPILCETLNSRFSDLIKSERLVIENVVLVSTLPEEIATSSFFVHKSNHLISSVQPKDREKETFTETQILACTPSSLVKKYLQLGYIPKYIKIDLEGYDAEIVQNLFQNEIFPEFISCEAQSIRPVAALLANTSYRGFKLVNSAKVNFLKWTKPDGNTSHFVEHSSGPFGEDIPGPWYLPESFFLYFGIHGPGWFDVHACLYPEPRPSRVPKFLILATVLTRLSIKVKRQLLGK